MHPGQSFETVPAAAGAIPAGRGRFRHERNTLGSRAARKVVIPAIVVALAAGFLGSFLVPGLGPVILGWLSLAGLRDRVRASRLGIVVAATAVELLYAFRVHADVTMAGIVLVNVVVFVVAMLLLWKVDLVARDAGLDID